MQLHGVQRKVIEWGYLAGKAYADPFNELEVDVEITHEDGTKWRVPAYWSGEQAWRIRFAPPRPGAYHFCTVCTDAGNADLHGQQGTLHAAAYAGDNPLLRHGSVRASADRRAFAHEDGTPFFWLGDTWWMGLCKRWSMDDFRLMTADRAQQGFTVIQIVAGLYPDMPAFDPRGANEAGFPWELDFARINPAYFDMADLRIQWLVRNGLMPCIVGCWGYFLPWMGEEKMRKHWRNLVARWGAYPVVWCLAGEVIMPYYLSDSRDADIAAQRVGWTRLGRYLREIDPYRHPISAHAGLTGNGYDQVDDLSVLDFGMPQPGHGNLDAVRGQAALMVRNITHEPRMPVVNSEANYEGIMGTCWEEVQRFTFWSTMLSGAAGFTYGANGIWQINARAALYGPSPHGFSWGDTPWEEAYLLPGGRQVAIGKRILQRFNWQRFAPHQEWVEPAAHEGDYQQPYAAGIPGEVRVIYTALSSPGIRVTLKGLEPGIRYTATYHDPRTGCEVPCGPLQPEADGSCLAPQPPLFQDWVLVLEGSPCP